MIELEKLAEHYSLVHCHLLGEFIQFFIQLNKPPSPVFVQYSEEVDVQPANSKTESFAFWFYDLLLHSAPRNNHHHKLQL